MSDVVSAAFVSMPKVCAAKLSSLSRSSRLRSLPWNSAEQIKMPGEVPRARFGDKFTGPARTANQRFQAGLFAAG